MYLFVYYESIVQHSALYSLLPLLCSSSDILNFDYFNNLMHYGTLHYRFYSHSMIVLAYFSLMEIMKIAISLFLQMFYLSLGYFVCSFIEIDSSCSGYSECAIFLIIDLISVEFIHYIYAYYYLLGYCSGYEIVGFDDRIDFLDG